MDTRQEMIAVAAQRLSSAEKERTPCEPIRDLIGEKDIELAYAIQQHNIAREQQAGRRISGRKIGITALSVQRQLNVFEPDFGTLFADMEIGHGGVVPAGRLIKPKVEAEVMIVLNRDLDHEMISFSDVIRATEFAVASLEIVDCRLKNWDIRITDTVADNAAAAMYVVGAAPKPMLTVDLANCAMSLHRNGELVSEGRGELCMGHPINAAVWLARSLYRLGTPLKAGDAILTGALGPMVAAEPGDRFEAHIEGLGSVIAEFER
ncbi:fumarylacetoacetate hydrolase family protein [Burkholderia lata]|uniref:fumarylacetoacetate hydrolase family protein n=1 Tax=Burkholderia lata (strain ATCC 17760 / DSM 23089 / LMG 22485 / NCIMB 9086 / R18194 / 383) TaxID=482957 RepID=UPI0014549C62|nr:fumarylacetoacetate hydrolase family protein [Burkholderia lata]VWB87902.1 4-oxalocrotonate decarboxylase [Burkholderia lata]